MMVTFKELTEYFQQVGAAEVAHSTKTYLAHAIGVYNDLKKWGCDEEVARAGLFHSIYGTELFQRFTLPLERRGEVRELIGRRAEQIAWMNCAIDRAYFDREVLKSSGPYRILDRFSGQELDVSDEDFHDLCVVHMCDWLEQVERSNAWDYRRTAGANLAKRLGGIALESYQKIFAAAPRQQWFDEYRWPETAVRGRPSSIVVPATR
jgi:hypothetical protein